MKSRKFNSQFVTSALLCEFRTVFVVVVEKGFLRWSNHEDMHEDLPKNSLWFIPTMSDLLTSESDSDCSNANEIFKFPQRAFKFMSHDLELLK